MKKNLLLSISSFLFTVMMLYSCQKETLSAENELNSPDGLAASKLPPGQKNQCRLVSLNSNFGFTSSVSYNSKGLADNWSASYDFGAFVYTTTMQYNANDRLTSAQYLYNGVHYYDIHYVYEGNRVVKENWYLANTNILDDEVFFTYNNRGHAIRQQSFIYGVDAHMMPDAKGNDTRYDIYFDGTLVQTGLYTFNVANKNPRATITGIPYGIFSYGFQFSKWWETSESIFFYDEDGNPVYYYDQDPALTTMTMNDQNYLLDVNHYDRLSGDLFNYSFDYENCAGTNAKGKTTNPPGAKQSAGNSKKLQLMKVMSSHGKEFKENLLKLRKQVVEKNRK